MTIGKLKESYSRKKQDIRKRLSEFKKAGRGDKIFEELCFCLLTPQSKAVNCDKAIQELNKKGLLLKGNARRIAPILRKFTRFHNKKTCFIISARRVFCRNRLDFKNSLKSREWLVNNIQGMRYKEASHFLRNIGLGEEIAILDTHILKNLLKLSVIDSIPKSLNKKTYLDIESKMRVFSERIGIPMGDLDLLFWSNQTGYIFK